MSQEKVTKYKEEKANRKETMKKQKRARLIRNSVLGIVFVAVVGWIGYSAVAHYQDTKPRKEAVVDFTAVDEYINEISAE